MQPTATASVYKLKTSSEVSIVQSKLITISSLLVSATLLISSAAFAQKGTKPVPKPYTDAELRKMAKGKMQPPSGASFYIGAVDGAPGRFSVLLTDSGQKFVNESYLVNQLEVIAAVMVEAQKFARNEESAGKIPPVITRFADKQEPTFLVDVEKKGDQSRFYVTINAIGGQKLTVDMGGFKRNDPDKTSEESGLYFKLLERVRAAIEEGRQ
jgi:hypothetical protein